MPLKHLTRDKWEVLIFLLSCSLVLLLLGPIVRLRCLVKEEEFVLEDVGTAVSDGLLTVEITTYPSKVISLFLQLGLCCKSFAVLGLSHLLQVDFENISICQFRS